MSDWQIEQLDYKLNRMDDQIREIRDKVSSTSQNVWFCFYMTIYGLVLIFITVIFIHTNISDMQKEIISKLNTSQTIKDKVQV